jgi:hypothetical protein
MENSEDFCGVRLRVSAKAAPQKAESEPTANTHHITGAENLMEALISESEGPVRSLLDASMCAASCMGSQNPRSS